MTTPTSLVLTAGLLTASVLSAPLTAQTAVRVDASADQDPSFGRSLASVGDVDGDGVADLLVGTRAHGTIANFRLWVVSGRTGTLVREHFGTKSDTLLGLPDVDGDGVAEYASATLDAAGTVNVYSGATGGLIYQMQAPGTEDFGRSMAVLGDPDGDGIPELVVGAVDAVWHVELTLPVWTATLFAPQLAHAGDDFGAALCVPGDVDGDGSPDVFVSAPGHDVIGAPDVGRLEALDTSGAGLWTLMGTVSGARLGTVLTGLHDVDDDGRPDVAHSDGPAGFFTQIRSGATGTMVDFSLETYDQLARADDLDGDGTPDLLGTTAAFGSGQVHVLSGVDLTPLWSDGASTDDATFGMSLAACPDMTGDGVADFVVGAGRHVTNPDGGFVALYSGAGCEPSAEIIGPGLAGGFGSPPLLFALGGGLGGTTTIGIGSSSTHDTFGVLFVGVAEATLPFRGGFVHLHPAFTLDVPLIPFGGVAFDIQHPDDTLLCGFRLLLQAAMWDDAAPLDVALTAGVALTVGGDVQWPD